MHAVDLQERSSKVNWFTGTFFAAVRLLNYNASTRGGYLRLKELGLAPRAHL